MGAGAVARNALRRGYFSEMVRKVYLRLRYGRRERQAATLWAARHAQDMGDWARSLDASLWSEASAFVENQRINAIPRLEELKRQGIDLGGGGGSELLYFLARRLRPAEIVETGVAAGWSTAALLGAIRANGHGHLQSSDFPYFRIDHPEQYVGYLVPDELRAPWSLYLNGDRRNLKEILRPGLRVGLAHYDSDKSRAGRKLFLDRIGPHLTEDAVVVIDDINDDLFFRDLITERSVTPLIFPYGGKYIGVLGL